MIEQFKEHMKEYTRGMVGESIDDASLDELAETLVPAFTIVGATIGMLAYNEPLMKAAARATRSYYEALIEEGFTADQALTLTAKVNFFESTSKGR